MRTGSFVKGSLAIPSMSSLLFDIKVHIHGYVGWDVQSVRPNSSLGAKKQNALHNPLCLREHLVIFEAHVHVLQHMCCKLPC